MAVVDVRSERLQVRRARKPQMSEAKDVLDAAEERVVVVRRVVDGSRLDVLGDEHRARPTAAGAGRRTARVRRIRPGFLAAACAGIAAARLVERDDEQAALRPGG